MYGRQDYIISIAPGAYISQEHIHKNVTARTARTTQLILQSSNPNPIDATSWQFLGALRGMSDHWAIDATVFSAQNSMHCPYPGWPLGDRSDIEQDLFLIPLINPQDADLKTLVCICLTKWG